MQVPVSTDFVISFLFEVEDQVAATGQLVVRDAVAAELLATERHAADKFLAIKVAIGFDNYVALGIVTLVEMQRHTVENGRSEGVVGRSPLRVCCA